MKQKTSFFNTFWYFGQKSRKFVENIVFRCVLVYFMFVGQKKSRKFVENIIFNMFLSIFLFFG